MLFQRTIEAEITINAPVDRVWTVLTDFGAYPEWNPFIRRAEGLLMAGRRLKLRIDVPQGWKMTLRPKILEVDEPRSFRWLGNFLVAGLFDGDHRFVIARVGPKSTRLLQREVFRGILVPLLGAHVGRGALRGFNAMNQAVRRICEAGPPRTVSSP